MRIGFIGAGKVGWTMGKHFQTKFRSSDDLKNRYSLTGYYSKHIDSSKAAATFTDTNYYEDIEGLVNNSEIIFITVPDSQIAVIVEKLNGLGDLVDGKIICHTSGALSSEIFSGINRPIFGYSIHPIYAVNSKTESYINFKNSFITIEGHERYANDLYDFFVLLGHNVKILDGKNKAKYHCAAVFASNLVVGLYSMASDLLEECGFESNEANYALKPLFMNNANNIFNEDEIRNALTGPLERGDLSTIKGHLDVIGDEQKNVYKLLSKQLLKVVDCADNREKYGLIEEFFDI